MQWALVFFADRKFSPYIPLGRYSQRTFKSINILLFCLFRLMSMNVLEISTYVLCILVTFIFRKYPNYLLIGAHLNALRHVHY